MTPFAVVSYVVPDFILVAKDRMNRGTFDRQPGVISRFDSFTHAGHVRFRSSLNSRVIRLPLSADAVRQIGHRALDTIVVWKQLMDGAHFRRGGGTLVHTHHARTMPHA